MSAPKLIDVTPFEATIIKVNYDGFDWENLRPVCQNLINQRSPQKININNLTTGVYYVKIYANKKVYVQRVFIANN